MKLPAMPAAPEAIRLKGVSQNNLKNIDLDIPLGKLVVVTGLSGAGKSSLVFETLHAEGQRRYVETFSPYTRQFLDRMDRPKVREIENIRPSIAVEQGNTVKTSRSTVGTMTELCDYFKVWFSHYATLYDPLNHQPIRESHPQDVWKNLLSAEKAARVLVTFRIRKPENMDWAEILQSLQGQGFTRFLKEESVLRSEELILGDKDSFIDVVQDRLSIEAKHRNRFLEAAEAAFHFGGDEIAVYFLDTGKRQSFFRGLKSSVNGRRFRSPSPNLFSFNSPLGACARCRGFGRIIELDDRLIMPNTHLSIGEGLIKAFSGAVYSESQRDLMRACKKHGIRTDVPWDELSESEKHFVMHGEVGYVEGGDAWKNAWYGVRNFFSWLESNTYKMHVRVFLSKYRSYVTCPDCQGARLQEEALCWKWQGYRLPDLYQKPVTDLLGLLDIVDGQTGDLAVDVARKSMRQRLRYLDTVGLGYLTLDRSSRTLSGGESQRVNLTTCLGASLVDTLFVLDEPSIGLHARDIDRLIRILRELTDSGNTVVVVEHDEAVMRAADHLIEVGPRPGKDGGQIVFSGNFSQIGNDKRSITAAYLRGEKVIALPAKRRTVSAKAGHGWLRLQNIRRHNINGLDLELPLERFVVLAGVSGSGKSTLLHDAIFQGWRARSGAATESLAQMDDIDCDRGFSEVVMIDQSPASRTPRSNPALFVDAWEAIRKRYATTEEARASGLTASAFSFNSGDGRCPHCDGLGHEKIEMQFMADIYVTCPVCDGRRFRPEIQEILWLEKSVSDVLEMTVDEALLHFNEVAEIKNRVQPLADVGLGYLPLGQPLNTLSGGESQRLKLVKYLSKVSAKAAGHALILLDEPTTGLHRHDIQRLLEVLQRLVDAGHSLVVIEHQMDVIKSADWVIEMGPEAGSGGGQLLYAGTPEGLARRTASSATAKYLKAAIEGEAICSPTDSLPIAAEAPATYRFRRELEVIGAREHNLKKLNVSLPHNGITVVTGVSGSGKSTLAFDIIFSEGQRRFMESMSSWARQFVEQMPRPQVDAIHGIQPTVAIEQRVTRGTRKSTTATITEVAQYLRLLFARVGVQHSLHSGEPLQTLSLAAVSKLAEKRLRRINDEGKMPLYLCAPLIRGRKGHHEPVAKWAQKQGYGWLRIDGDWVDTEDFKKLDRYREHDIEVGIAMVTFSGRQLQYAVEGPEKDVAADPIAWALKLGKGVAFFANESGEIIFWISITRTDPVTGEAYPDLDPKHFSWNSPRGWCTTCRGHGELHGWMSDQDGYDGLPDEFETGEVCPDCNGSRLNPVSRAVFLPLKNGKKINLPQLLAHTPNRLLEVLDTVESDERGMAVIKELLPEIRTRLQFMGDVGLDYLSLDRSTNTLSGGEAQRIRLSAQLGSNLSGSLYVLDEPSIGLHARDNDKLLQSLHRLKAKGNTLLIVEHDLETMRQADRILDLGPAAGIHGGELLACGTLDEILENKDSITSRYLRKGMTHPSRGAYRKLPAKFNSRSKISKTQWLCLEKPTLRNLKGGRLLIPLQNLTVVCGISGAGKSTLVRDLLCPAVAQAIAEKKAILKGSASIGFERLLGGNQFGQVIEVDQNPIGKTPRSTPATYIGVFDRIRQFFSSLPEAKMRGFSAGTFSFNTRGGRCESCQGAGRIKLEMNFLPDTYLVCDDCQGRRYGEELSEIRWNGKNIAEVLQMSFAEAAEFFNFHHELKSTLDLMVETGLDYLTLGQSSPTLSGGEAQRLKLVSELSKGRKDGNLYILEEPTIGLHASDCERLIHLLHRLIEQGHTVIVIEHNLDVIQEADYLVEIGPEGGEQGGKIQYQGTVQGLRNSKNSATAPFLS